MGDPAETPEEMVSEPVCGKIFEGPPNGKCELPPKHKGMCHPYHERCSYRRSNGDRCRKHDRHGDTEGPTKHLFLKAKRVCICSACDMLRYFDYARRLTGLPDGLDEDSPRMELINDIHSTIGMRHPLGLAERLYEAITSIHIGEDGEAQDLFYTMVNDEKFLLVQGNEFEILAEECKVARKLYEDRSKIPETP